MALTLLLVGLFVFMGHLLVSVFQRTRVPDVLILILVGIAIGPYGLDQVRAEDLGKIGPVFSTFALLVLLFEGGIGLDIKAIFSNLWPCTRIAITTALITLGAVSAIAYGFTSNLHDSLALGAMLSCVSAAVVIPLVQQLPVWPSTRTLVVMESAITDVFAIVCVFFIDQFAVQGTLEVSTVLLMIPMTIVIPIIVGVVGAVLWRLVVTRVRRFPNTAFTEFALVCVLYGVAESMHGNGAITALVFGICVTNLPRGLLTGIKRVPLLRLDRVSPGQMELFAEGAFLIKLWFFILLGISLRFDDTLAFVVGGWMVLAIYGARLIIVAWLLPPATKMYDAAMVSLLVPKGLVSAVLASAYLAARPDSESALFIRDVAYAVVLISIGVTSVLIPAQSLSLVRGAYRMGLQGFAPDEAPPRSNGAMPHR